MLPFLVIAFLISYGLMVMLIVEQDQTIGSQRSLIRQLFTDSVELSSIKSKAVHDHNAKMMAEAQARAQKTPMSQVTPEDNPAGKPKTGKQQKQAPLKLPQDTSDKMDERRTLNSI